MSQTNTSASTTVCLWVILSFSNSCQSFDALGLLLLGEMRDWGTRKNQAQQQELQICDQATQQDQHLPAVISEEFHRRAGGGDSGFGLGFGSVR